MTGTTTNLFVYGTLMPGHFRYASIEKHVHDARPGRIQGILVDLGAFPALIAGDGIVQGIVLEVDEDAIKVTDRIEGYDPVGGSSLYLRKSVTVNCDDGQMITAWTYFFARPETIHDRTALVIAVKDSIPIHAWLSDS